MKPTDQVQAIEMLPENFQSGSVQEFDLHSSDHQPLSCSSPLDQLSPENSGKGKSRSKRVKHAWDEEQNLKLQALHDQLGNKWCAISKKFEEKSENDVKNHFFSQLRMSLRHLNKITGRTPEFKSKPIRAGIIYKVISCCEQRYREDSKSSSDIINLAFAIKKGLFDFLTSNREQQKQLAVEVATQIKKFSTIICKNSKGKKKDLSEELQIEESGLDEENHHQYFSDDFREAEKEEVRTPEAFEERPLMLGQAVLRDSESINMKPEETCQLLPRPEICLLNPFEQIIQYVQEDSFPSLFKEDSGEYIPFYLWNQESKEFGSL